MCNVRATGRPWTEAQVRSHLVADGNPRQLDRRARRLRVRCSTRLFSLNWCRAVPESAVTCHPVRLPASTEGRRIPGAAENCRDIRANIERTSTSEGLDQYGNDHHNRRTRRSQRSRAPASGCAFMTDTIRSLRLVDDAFASIRRRQRGHCPAGSRIRAVYLRCTTRIGSSGVGLPAGTSGRSCRDLAGQSGDAVSVPTAWSVVVTASS
jgi:hypothetical protein